MIRQFLQSNFYLKGRRPFFLIILLGFLIYFPTLFFNFTYLDDNTLILDNQFFLSDLSNIGEAFRTDVFHIFNHSAFYYRPILTISFMLDYQIGGVVPFIYHFSNLLFHILVVCLLFIFLRKLKYRKDISFLFSLVYLSHPVLTQAVAWVPGRNDSLATIFILSSFICFIQFLKRNQTKYFIPHLLFFALAIFTKETALFVIPLFIFFFYFLNLKKEDVSKGKVLAGWAVILGLWFFLRSLIPNSSVFLISTEMVKSVLNNLSAVIQLIGKSFFPFNLSVLPIIQDTSFIYGILAVILVIVLVILKKNKRWNHILFGLTWFLFFLLPSFLKLNPGSVVDFIEHRLYLPIIGLFIIILELNPVKNWRENKIHYYPVLFVVLIFSFLTFFHSFNFSNRLSFWQNAVETSPHHPLAHRNLGAMLYLEGDMVNAEREFKTALELNPNEEMAHNNLGLVYFNLGKLEESEVEYKKELEINPFYDNAYFNLGLLYYRKEQVEDAETVWKKVLEINPNNLDAIYNLLSLYYEKEDLDNFSFYVDEINKRGLTLPNFLKVHDKN